MSSLAIDGLISGLNTTSLINQLMTVESAPQTLLKGRVSTTQTLVTALQTLNSSVAALATRATSTALPASVELFSASSSASSVSASAAAGATAGQISLSVTAIAKAQVTVSAAMTEWPDSPATFTIVSSTGVKTELTAASTSMADIATAINDSSTGVTAVRVAAGTDGLTGDPLYRLQLSSSTTGAAAAFSVFRGTAADVTANTAPNILSSAGAATISTAGDASVSLWAGTAAEQVITSATNTFSDILPGVDIAVSAVETSPVSITVARDSAAVGRLAASLVSSLASVFSFIDEKTAISTATSSTGATSTTGGVFTGSALVRDVRTKVIAAASAPIDGRSPSEIGLTITRTGTMEYDATKFATALAADPEGTQAMLQAIAARIASVATDASDKYTGTITQTVTGQQTTLSSLATQIASWDVRLASQRAGLEKTYAALEVALSNLNAQSTWLESQVAALTSST